MFREPEDEDIERFIILSLMFVLVYAWVVGVGALWEMGEDNAAYRFGAFLVVILPPIAIMKINEKMSRA